MKRSNFSCFTARFTCLACLLPAAAIIGAVGCGSTPTQITSSFEAGVGGDGGLGDGTTGHKGHDSGKLGAPDSSGDTGSGEACAASSAKADVAPLDMYILLDWSGSMGVNNAWTEEVQALEDFVYDVNSSGIGVGIQYLPLPQLCDPAAYAQPAVPVAPLPGNQAQIVTSLANTRPYGGTPTVPALEGAITLGKQRQAQNPERDFVIVLSTDGVPDTSCSFVADGGLPNSTQNAISVIEAAAKATPPIRTFVIGVGNEPALNAFAAAGGTGQAILVGAGDAGTTVDIETPLIAALSAIRTNALPCQYNIPQASQGAIDFSEVNVTFTPNVGAGQQFYGVADAAHCTTTSSDWYYGYGADGGTMPTHIELCPTACTEVKGSTNGSVDVAYGCVHTLPPPIK